MLQRLELNLPDGKPDSVSLVGPSFSGWIYRSNKNPSCYRILPIQETPLERRDAIRKWITRPRQRGIAPVVQADQVFIHGAGYFFVRYEIQPQLTWSEIRSQNYGPAFLHAIQTLRIVSEWWEKLSIRESESLMITPVDIIWSDRIPHLLAMPPWRLPPIDALFAEPRAIYIPHEILTGKRPPPYGRTLDIYSLGIFLMQCLFEFPTITTEKILARIANRTFTAPERFRSRLPFWLENLESTTQTISAIRRMLDPDPLTRAGIDLQGLADQLENYAREFDPIYTVQQLRSAKKPKDAFLLLRDILLSQASYDLLLLGAQLAWEDLRLPLEAIDLYEKAISLDAQNTRAYEGQLEIITSEEFLYGALITMENKDLASLQLDKILWRDFEHVPPENQKKYELTLAHHLLAQKKFQEAASFIYPRLFKEGTYQFWKFGMILAYVEAFIELGMFQEAETQLNGIKQGIEKVKENRSMSPQEIHQYGSMLADLEAHLHERKRSNR